ncbi:neuronal calcium sensor 1 [Enteropsectra breve]|nr:neuronal calcium sensor 1 [Enteropsectra breve]
MGNTDSRIKSSDSEVKKFSHFAAEDVMEWLSYYQSICPDGYLSRADLEMIFIQLFPFGKPQKFSEALFRTINIGNTGLADFNELLIAFSILAKGSSFEKQRWIFRLYDGDGDGVVSREDMEKAMQGLVELTGIPIDNEKTLDESISEMLDGLENRSGFLTFNDFEILCNKNSNFFKSE